MTYRNVLDLGSSSFHLVHAGMVGGRIDQLFDQKRMVRLGHSAFATGRIDASAWQRGMNAVGELHQVAAATKVPTIAVATSVFRDTTNGRAFLDAIHANLGLEVELLSEEAEAQLSFRGAMFGAYELERALVIDLGGGSIEIAAGSSADLQLARSFPCGVLRLASLCLDVSRILDSAGANAIRHSVSDAMAASLREARRLRPERIVLSAGTARLLARLCPTAQGACSIDRIRLDGLIRWLEGRSPRMLVSDGMPTARADTIAAGAVAVATILDLLDVTAAQVTPRGLREGVLLREVAIAV